MNNNGEMIVSNNDINEIKKALQAITVSHQEVSHIETPVSEIKQIEVKEEGRSSYKIDYVELYYMRHIADRYFPGWSWEVINTEVLGTEAYVIHGRLKWFDNGIQRTGDITAAHRIQKRKDGNGFVNIGNDIKGANTDCMKKAFNTYMNIADDVYRNQVVNLNADEIKSFKKLMIKENFEKSEQGRLLKQVYQGKINKKNINVAKKFVKETKKENKQ